MPTAPRQTFQLPKSTTYPPLLSKGGQQLCKSHLHPHHEHDPKPATGTRASTPAQPHTDVGINNSAKTHGTRKNKTRKQ